MIKIKCHCKYFPEIEDCTKCKYFREVETDRDIEVKCVLYEKRLTEFHKFKESRYDKQTFMEWLSDFRSEHPDIHIILEESTNFKNYLKIHLLQYRSGKCIGNTYEKVDDGLLYKKVLKDTDSCYDDFLIQTVKIMYEKIQKEIEAEDLYG